ncbi:MAG: radical SAM family heme chaperone HemW [Pontiellaceae bacterium]|nr:radical SAM family heme chaperone HemW [Pontiellaceae bacterium]
MTTGLYIHVPFCAARCSYCDFYSTVSDGDAADRYLSALGIELERLPSDFAPDTVFIGGGTPTALTAGQYAAMLETLRSRINLSNVIEFTSEANPGTLTPEKLAAMKEGGIDRVSIGVQSFNSEALRLLGRIHTAEQAVESFHALRAAGFENVNVDLIQSIPGMTPEEVLADARRVVELAPEHISYYNLIYEAGTPLTSLRDDGRIVPPGDDEEADHYYAVKDLLESAGYEHYEISNFSKPGRRCLHNVLYWQGGSYFGCGPSAHSHWNGKRFGNVADLAAWCTRMEQGARPFDETETLPPEDKARETLVMWLRMLEGVDADEFEQCTGFSMAYLCGEALQSLADEDLLEKKTGRWALSRLGLFVCNSIFAELV